MEESTAFFNSIVRCVRVSHHSHCHMQSSSNSVGSLDRINDDLSVADLSSLILLLSRHIHLPPLQQQLY